MKFYKLQESQWLPVLYFFLTVVSLDTFAGQRCISFYSPVKKIGSKQITSLHRSTKQNDKEFYEWTLEDYLNLEGQVVEMYRDRRFGNKPPVVQQILFLDKFASDEALVIRKLVKLSNTRKFKSRDQQRRYEKDYKYYKELLDKYGGATEEEIKSMAIKSALQSPGVEAGAWVIHTKSGKMYTAIHTTGHSEEVGAEAVNRSINALFETNSIRADDILNISYYHTHPNGGPLSYGDHTASLNVMESLKDQGVQVPFHAYAISQLDGDIVLFHAGYLMGESE